MDDRRAVVLAALVLVGGGAMACGLLPATPPRRWIAGDSHIHTHWSPRYDLDQMPPAPIVGGDAQYSIPVNARKAVQYGLRWMVTTDHGGPNHSKLNLTHAYAELLRSREMVPELLQFYGMEFNMPGMDHHTLIVPFDPNEANVLYDIERRFDANETWPQDPSRNTHRAGQRVLEFVNGLERVPLMFANHPSRSATGLGRYGLSEPWELRDFNDVAPDVYHGMEGAPGHQATSLAADGSIKVDDEGRPRGNRGGYGRTGARTLGGFDQMTAVLGGLWDSMLGEGRRFWIVATSDSHGNFADPTRAGADFWPGQYQKTYVLAAPTYADVLDGLRNGRIFAVSGDLISELDVTVASGRARAIMGGTLTVPSGADVQVTVRLRDPRAANANGDTPRAARLDIIVGDVYGPTGNPDLDHNVTTRVMARVARDDWDVEPDPTTGSDTDRFRVTVTLPAVDRSRYVRVRGTNGDDLEPPMDATGENPWHDLWFYSNPVFVNVE